MKITTQTTSLPWHPSRRWSSRSLLMINKIIIHQELADGSVAEVNNYHIRPGNHISKSGCPHLCYHYGIEKTGEIIMANEIHHITWHTAGQNESGIGILLTGDFDGPGHVGTAVGPGEKQMEALAELCETLQHAFGLDNRAVFGHCHFGKPACPGWILEEWIEGKRRGR